MRGLELAGSMGILVGGCLRRAFVLFFFVAFLASCLQSLRFHRFSYDKSLNPKS